MIEMMNNYRNHGIFKFPELSVQGKIIAICTIHAYFFDNF